MINPDIKLISKKVTLRILRKEDFEAFKNLAADESIWNYYSMRLSDDDTLIKFIDDSLRLFVNRERIPFAIVNNETEEVIGSTSFMAISEHDKRAEIGTTWLGKEFQGKGFNKPCKYLLLSYAFENWGLERVEFKTDELNLQSRKAIEKIGATQEGVFRSHMTMPNNRRRDSVYYSIIKNEWTEIKNRIFNDISNEI